MKYFTFFLTTLILLILSCNLEEVSNSPTSTQGDKSTNIQKDSMQGDTTQQGGVWSDSAELDLPTLEKLIRGLFINANCDSSAQCRSIGFGSKPCGGHWDYLIYSTQSTDTVLLQNKVKEYNERDEQRNREQGFISDCSYLLEPTLGCQEKVCSSI